MRPQPLIAVQDTEASSCWYQPRLGCQRTHSGPNDARRVANDVLMVHMHPFAVEDHDGPIGDPPDQPYDNGVVVHG